MGHNKSLWALWHSCSGGYRHTHMYSTLFSLLSLYMTCGNTGSMLHSIHLWSRKLPVQFSSLDTTLLIGETIMWYVLLFKFKTMLWDFAHQERYLPSNWTTWVCNYLRTFFLFSSGCNTHNLGQFHPRIKFCYRKFWGCQYFGPTPLMCEAPTGLSRLNLVQSGVQQMVSPYRV